MRPARTILIMQLSNSRAAEEKERKICLRTSGRTDRTGYQVKPEKEYIKIRMGQRTVHKRMWTVRIFMRYNNAIRNKS